MKLVRPLLLAGLAAILSWVVVQNLALGSARTELDQTLLLTTRAVEAEVERLRSLPAVAAEDVRIRDALAGTGSLQDANLYLETLTAHTQAGDLFLINAQGDTISASNWNSPGSFVGQNYAFRPYFHEAMQTGQGDFYAPLLALCWTVPKMAATSPKHPWCQKSKTTGSVALSFIR